MLPDFLFDFAEGFQADTVDAHKYVLTQGRCFYTDNNLLCELAGLEGIWAVQWQLPKC
ncbi:hypothetical protein NUKP40_39000 [Klebsiella variicola]|nr:hypothetical protein NUKP40_39000 [Klebsiella variicola]